MAQNLRQGEIPMNDLGMFLMSCEQLPEKWHEPLYVPLLMTIVGAIVFGLGSFSEAKELKPKPWKWVSMLFLILGLYAGGSLALCMTGSFYKAAVIEVGKKMVLGHVAGLLIPLFAMLAIGIYHWKTSRDPYR